MDKFIPTKEQLKAMPCAEFLETDYWKEIASRVKEREPLRGAPNGERQKKS